MQVALNQMNTDLQIQLLVPDIVCYPIRKKVFVEVKKTKKINNQTAPDSVEDLLPRLKKLYAPDLIEFE